MGFMDNVMGSFNDEAGKINTGTGQYRVMQVVRSHPCLHDY